MYFYLKEPKSAKETTIIIQYYVKLEGKNFKYSTGEKIHPDNWNFKDKIPKSKKGMTGAKLKKIRTAIIKYDTLLQKLIDNCKLNNIPITRTLLKSEFDAYFKGHKTPENESFNYFVDFIDHFAIKAPNLINRNTKENYSYPTIKVFKRLSRILKDFEIYQKRKIKLNNFDLKVYDKFMLYLAEQRKYKTNYIGNLIKVTKQLLKVADKEFKYNVHKDYTESGFAVISEEVNSIALNESEIELLLRTDFSDRKDLENCRDFAIIGMWTGLRIGDLLNLPKIEVNKTFITVQPQKTKKSSGIKVVIPLHHHIKEILQKRGMPKPISNTSFNIKLKEICKHVKLDELTKGSLQVWNEDIKAYRKKDGLYPKHSLVSSHTCRRSFATNLYNMNFPTLSIMKITGHKSEKSFLKYIKVTPQEHAEKLLNHWENYYANKNKEVS